MSPQGSDHGDSLSVVMGADGPAGRWPSGTYVERRLAVSSRGRRQSCGAARRRACGGWRYRRDRRLWRNRAGFAKPRVVPHRHVSQRRRQPDTRHDRHHRVERLQRDWRREHPAVIRWRRDVRDYDCDCRLQPQWDRQYRNLYLVDPWEPQRFGLRPEGPIVANPQSREPPACSRPARRRRSFTSTPRRHRAGNIRRRRATTPTPANSVNAPVASLAGLFSKGYTFSPGAIDLHRRRNLRSDEERGADLRIFGRRVPGTDRRDDSHVHPPRRQPPASTISNSTAPRTCA